MNLTTLILGVLAAPVAIAAHELGHLAASLATGGRFAFFAVGPLLVERTPEGRIRAAWNRSPHFFGGISGALPMRLDRVRARFALVLACGPLASLLLALAAHAALVQGAPAGGARAALQWLRLLSGALFVATALPLPNGPWVTDGQRLVRLLSRGPYGRRELAVVTMTVLESRGVPPHAWDPALLADGLAVRDGSIFEYQTHLWSWARARDTGDAACADAALASARALAPRMPAMLRDECLRLDAGPRP